MAENPIPPEPPPNISQTVTLLEPTNLSPNNKHHLTKQKKNEKNPLTFHVDIEPESPTQRRNPPNPHDENSYQKDTLFANDPTPKPQVLHLYKNTPRTKILIPFPNRNPGRGRGGRQRQTKQDPPQPSTPKRSNKTQLKQVSPKSFQNSTLQTTLALTFPNFEHRTSLYKEITPNKSPIPSRTIPNHADSASAPAPNPSDETAATPEIQQNSHTSNSTNLQLSPGHRSTSKRAQTQDYKYTNFHQLFETAPHNPNNQSSATPLPATKQKFIATSSTQISDIHATREPNTHIEMNSPSSIEQKKSCW